MVLPFTNHTGRPEFGYHSVSLARLLASRLTEIPSVTIDTQTLSAIPGANILPPGPSRKLIVIDPSDLTNSGTAGVRPDWIVSGSYRVLQDDFWRFSFSLSDRSGRGFTDAVDADQRSILESAYEIALPFWRYFGSGPVRPLRIVSDPVSAEIRRDGVFLGHTPFTVVLDGVSREYEIRGEGRVLGRTNLSGLVTVSTMRFRPVLASPGTVCVIRTLPAGAPVWFDGYYLGKAPATNRSAPFGPAVLQSSLPGYKDAYRRVEVNGRNRSFLLSLQPDISRTVYFTPKRLFWTSLSTGLTATLAGVACQYLADEYERTRLKRPIQPKTLRAVAPWCYAVSVPFFSVAIWFHIRDSEGHDW
jgi:hypothetical protein